MTSVTMVTNDSAALHTTKTNNRNVKETQAYPASQAVKAREETAPTPQQNVKRNQRQRRKQERRQQQKSVLLDTRSGHDRRNIGNSQTAANEEDDNKQPVTSIDVYI